nr:helix-turn-helix domain-containing protein [Haloarcula sp. CBA1122]
MEQSAEVYGLSRSAGRIYGVLYFASDPLSIPELVEETGYAKSTVSNVTRTLSRIGLIHRRRLQGAADESGSRPNVRSGSSCRTCSSSTSNGKSRRRSGPSAGRKSRYQQRLASKSAFEISVKRTKTWRRSYSSRRSTPPQNSARRSSPTSGSHRVTSRRCTYTYRHRSDDTSDPFLR